MTPQKLNTRVAVFIILKNEAGEILLQQRANTTYLDGYYDFSCSGHVDELESLHEAAVRELAEELGVTASPDDLQLVHINHNYVDTPYMNFIFTLDKWQGTPRICEPEKCSDLQYFAPDQLPEKSTLIVRVIESEQFSNKLTYSKITKVEYDQLMKGVVAQ